MAKRSEIKLGSRVIKTNDFAGFFPELVGEKGTVVLDIDNEGPDADGCAVDFDNGGREWLFYENIELLRGE